VIENPDPREPWQVRTVAYHYTFGESGGNEMLSYEEHLSVLGSVSLPHLHLQYGAELGRSKFGRAHPPTGLITLEDTGGGGGVGAPMRHPNAGFAEPDSGHRVEPE
jgi:hypothetical protein